MLETLLSVVGMLAAVVVVLALAYLFTRYIGSRGLQGALGTVRGGRRMRLLEQLPLGKDQHLAVVELGERCLLLGVAPSGITLLAELTAEERKLWQEQQPGGDGQPPGFKQAMKIALDQRFGKR